MIKNENSEYRRVFVVNHEDILWFAYLFTLHNWRDILYIKIFPYDTWEG